MPVLLTMHFHCYKQMWFCDGQKVCKMEWPARFVFFIKIWTNQTKIEILKMLLKPLVGAIFQSSKQVENNNRFCRLINVIGNNKYFCQTLSPAGEKNIGGG